LAIAIIALVYLNRDALWQRQRSVARLQSKTVPAAGGLDRSQRVYFKQVNDIHLPDATNIAVADEPWPGDGHEA
jgi:hypothetical protein